MKLHLGFLLLVLLLPTMGIAQVESIESIAEKLKKYEQKHPQEKVYIRTDKEIYVQGSTIWLSAYVVDAALHLPSPFSKLLYVELLDPNDQVVANLNLPITNGVGKGDFAVKKKLAEGLYHIRAYTNYMKNYSEKLLFTRPIKILVLSDRTPKAAPTANSSKIDLQFFPEGGTLVADLLNHVAFKAIDENGKGMKINGNITDDRGKEIVQFDEKIMGMGSFLFTPEKGKKYFANYEYDGKKHKEALPKVLEAGYRLNVRQTKTKITVTAKATAGIDLSEAFVIGHVRGKIFMMAKGDTRQPFILSRMRSNQVPSGILHFTFFDAKGRPQCERLTYNENSSTQPIVEMKAHSVFAQRQKASFQLRLNDSEGNPLNGNVSVAVLSDKYNGANKINIENYLLFSSDLHGDIEHPELCFDKQNKKRRQHRDLLMMVNGWSRFTWQDVIDEQVKTIDHFAEQGFSIEGKVVKYGNQRKGVESSISVSFMENMLFEKEMATDKNGDFWFDGLQIADTLTVILNARKLKTNKNGETKSARGNTAIVLKKKTTPKIDYQFYNLFDTVQIVDEWLDNEIKIQNIEGQYDVDVITLDEVTVKAKKSKKNRPFYRENMLYSNPDTRMVMDSFSNAESFVNIYDMLRGKVAGVKIKGYAPNYKAFIRDQEATFLINGIPTTDELVNDINPSAVEFVDVVKGLKASVYGTGGPVIAIYLRTGNQNIRKTIETPKNFLAFTINGYYQHQQFYIPAYDKPKVKASPKLDFRSTLYWNPAVAVTNGQADFDFFTSDEKGGYYLFVEGLSEDGRVIEYEYRFGVE